MAGKDEKPSIIIRRVKKVQGGGHHGGSWKVAYADFVTAMMAFFMVMWLVGALTTKQREAVSDYFKNPSPVKGNSTVKAQGQNGPGGASNSMIKLGGTMELPKGPGEKFTRDPKDQKSDAEKKLEDKQRLESLMNELQEAIGKSQALEPFKDQLFLDITPEGLRIQIVDKKNRAMFDLGSAKLMPYTEEILNEIAKFINKVPNRVSIAGHTDTTRYATVAGYSNWELSADRANAARRSLMNGGMDDHKTARVVGFGDAVLFDKTDTTNPINRRISIVVMTKEAEEAALGISESKPISVPTAPASPAAAVAPTKPTPAAAVAAALKEVDGR
ncbi:MAG: flagellar motor protein MotB [Thermomonas sp.]|nr:flagellar motor protein MotB [Thermomonas sp.]